MAYTSSTIIGARPSDSSSAMSSRGDSTSTRASESMRCSPPDKRAGDLGAALAETREQLEGPVEAVGHAPAAEAVAERERQVLLDGEGGEHRPALGGVGDAGTCEAVGGLAGHVLAVDQHRARGRGDQPAGHPGDGGLADAVGSEQRRERGAAGIVRPVEVVASADTAAEVADQLRETKGVGAVVVPTAESWRADGDQLLQVYLAEDPASDAGAAALERIRAADVGRVGGSPAEDADFVSPLRQRRPGS